MKKELGSQTIIFGQMVSWKINFYNESHPFSEYTFGIRNLFLKSEWNIGGKLPFSVNITVKTGYAYSNLPILTNFLNSVLNFALTPCFTHDNC